MADQQTEVLYGLIAQMRKFEWRLAQLESPADSASGLSIDVAGAQNAQHDTRLDDLRRMLDDPEVEPYQPIYGLTGLLPEAPRRGCVDRCRAIEHSLGPVHDLRMLDIGSSLGYVSLHFADRGASVTGWESHGKNVAVADQVARITGVGVDFQTTRFDAQSIETITDNAYDVVLLLSVLHHLINSDGLESVQNLMADLLGKVPTLILELALKGEDANLCWDAAQPVDELAIFDKLRDDVKIVKIGEFGTHLSDGRRPLYAVSKIDNTVAVNGRDYRYETKSVEAYSGSPLPLMRTRRRYYFDTEHVVKEYDFAGDYELDNSSQIIAEITVLTDLAETPGIPKLLDYELGPTGARVVVKRIPGSLLVDQLGTTVGAEDARSIVEQILTTLATLEAAGLRHNDVRSWNVIYDGKTASLIDYGRVSEQSIDDDAQSLLWLLKAVATGEREDFDPREEALPPSELFATDPGLWRLFVAVQAGERSPRALLDVLKSATGA